MPWFFSTQEFKTEDTVEVTPFAMMVREDGDYKVLAPDETVSYNSFDNIPVDMQRILIDFNGFKLPIVEVKGKEDAILYLNENMIK